MVHQYERSIISEALNKTGGNQSQAARLLGIARRTLVNKIQAYGLNRP
jgi:DNA-binding NtrC family response regulator